MLDRLLSTSNSRSFLHLNFQCFYLCILCLSAYSIWLAFFFASAFSFFSLSASLAASISGTLPRPCPAAVTLVVRAEGAAAALAAAASAMAGVIGRFFRFESSEAAETGNCVRHIEGNTTPAAAGGSGRKVKKNKT